MVQIIEYGFCNCTTSVTLVAPCAPLTRVVLKHAGLAVTGKTSANGVLMMALPALEVQASIAAQLRGETVTAGLSIPEAAGLQRFAVQWLQDDAFQINAFEDGADYGGPGHVSAKAPHLPQPGMPASGGYLTQLGVADDDLAMQAEVYTFPARGNADLVIEAAVTPATCGRELLGEPAGPQRKCCGARADAGNARLQRDRGYCLIEKSCRRDETRRAVTRGAQ